MADNARQPRDDSWAEGAEPNLDASTVVSPQPGPAFVPPATPPVVAGALDRPVKRLAVDDGKTVISKRPPVVERPPSRSYSPLELGEQLEGKRLGHFQLEKFVGGGGMGAVFRALDTMLGRTVAVKVLSRDRTDDDTLRRFKNEAQSAARLDHRNIARVYYVGEDDGWNYIVFEFIAGWNVRELVDNQGPLPLEDALHYTVQIAEALEHAHRRDVVHRDIKPSNVIVTAEGRAKLVDMGLARLHQVESSSDDLTASGVTLGTFDYISPEQARDPRSADVRSDIYSLGCTVYFMLTGRPPFPDGTVLQKLLSHNSDAPPDPRIFRPELAECVIAVLNRMLAKQPDQRQQSPAELIHEWTSVATELGMSTVASESVWTPKAAAAPSWWEQHVPWLAPVALLIASVVTLDLVWGAPEPQLAREARAPARWASDPEAIEPAPTVEAEAPTAPLGVSPATTTGGGALPSTTPAVSRAIDDEGATSSGTNAPRDANLRTAPVPPMPEIPADRASPVTPPSVVNPANDPVRTDGGSSRRSPTAPAAPVNDDANGSPAEPMPRVEPDRPTPGVAAPAVARRNDVIVVAAADAEVEPTETVVATLDEAIRAAHQPGSEVRVIELRYTGEQRAEPAAIAREELTIRAASGHRPVVVFAPVLADLAEHKMLRLTGGRVVWEGVHLEMRLPPEPSFDGWTLFSLQNVPHLDFFDCTVTIVGADASGLTDQPVAVIRLEPPTAAEMMPAQASSSAVAPAAPPAPPSQIGLSRCIVRGEAALVYAPSARPFTLTWDQGLLATTRRMVVVGEAMMRPRLDDAIRLRLNHVTAAMNGGLLLAGAVQGEFSQHLLPIDVVCIQCAFRTDADAALVEQRGAQEPSVIQQLLSFEGSGVAYVRTSVLQRVNGEDVLPAPRGAVLNWRGGDRDQRPVDQHTKADYLLAEAANGGVARNAVGFDPQLLPDLPEPAAVPSR